MRESRKAIRPLKRRRKSRTNRLEGATEQAKADARVVALRERQANRQARARIWNERIERLQTGTKGAALETRRRLRPVATPMRAGLGKVAPPISRALLFVVRLPIALITALLAAFQGTAGWVRRNVVTPAASAGQGVGEAVTPVRAVAAIAMAAAVALAVSQFFDYRGVAVGAPQYEGAVGTAAPAPLTDLETAGSAHLYLPVALAAVALYLIWATARGSWRLGRAVGLVGVAAIAVSVIVDAPQGLDAGRAGVAYYGTEAKLIEGFWAQVSAAAVLVLCGPLLGRYVRLAAGDEAVAAPKRRAKAPRPWTRLRTET